MLSRQEQDTASVIDPAAEQKMVQNVLDTLLQDEESHEPRVSRQHAYLLCSAALIPVALQQLNLLAPAHCISTFVSTMIVQPRLFVPYKLT